jgi:hypothetical protein
MRRNTQWWQEILNFEGLDVTTLVMDSKFLKQVPDQIN